ncbi:MAG TPA: transcriptional regulator GcvA [Pseudorhodoplanes sp.]|jgi:LysR family glycine cleavage system transcriptional activator|nr:transcriptional regulator GcvA [Pseudorhodoplanes sp.]
MLRLPPLNALRAFEAAGRHLSFKRAAIELCVTQGAISRHIVNLEQHLGVSLFNRSHRQVTLTPEGAAYLQETRDAFLRIAHATVRAQSKPDEKTLRIKAPPTCSIRWLVPRLGRFHALHPGIAVQVTTSHDPLDFERDGVDVGVHYGRTIAEGWHCERLFNEVLIPICNRKILRGRNGRCSARDIASQVLLHSIRRPDDWRQWFDAAGLQGVTATQELTFENSTMTFQGAVDGLGVAIAQKALVIDDIASGRIVVPSDVEVRNPVAYYLVFPAEKEKSATVRSFHAFVAEEARATRAAAPSL